MDTVKAKTAALRLLTERHLARLEISHMQFGLNGWVVCYGVDVAGATVQRVAFITHDAALKWDMEA